MVHCSYATKCGLITKEGNVNQKELNKCGDKLQEGTIGRFYCALISKYVSIQKGVKR